MKEFDKVIRTSKRDEKHERSLNSPQQCHLEKQKGA